MRVTDGGLEVVPRSHLAPAKEALMGARDLRRAGDWCPLPRGYYPPDAAALVTCAARGAAAAAGARRTAPPRRDGRYARDAQAAVVPRRAAVRRINF